MPTPTTLLFLRHAETDLAGTFCGASDPPLNEKGLAQIPRLLKRIESQPLEAVYTSDLERARQTAEPLAEARKIRVFRRSALREIDFGDWEALTWKQIETLDPQYAARWVAEFPALPTPNGETITAFRHRVLNEIAFLRQAPFERIAIVTHAGVLRVLLEEFGHFAPQHAWERTRDYTCGLHCTQRSPTGTLTIHP
jgi:alpha-ribazole phosphatase/probable phosphoglycerate mutase